MSAEEKHARGVELYGGGRFQEAFTVLEEALRESEPAPAHFWNDWSAAAFACGYTDKAEEGFRNAVALNATDSEAAANLGTLLASLGRTEEAIPFLETAIRHSDPIQRARLIQLLADCRNCVTSQVLSETQEIMRSAFAELRGVCALPKALAEPVVVANVLSKVKKRPTDGCLVYKPDFLHVPFQVAELSGGRWESKPDHTVGSGSGASLRWRTVASKVYALLAHFPWGGKAALTVNGSLRDVVDLYSHAKYVEPLEVFLGDTTSAVELELRICGRNSLSRGDQLACFGFLVGRENSAEPPRRVETDEGFVAIQKQQIVNWLASIKHRGQTLEEVTQQRKGAYTLRVSEGMAFMPAGGRVLDLGCGYVFREILRDAILSRGFDYWLQDIDPEVCQSNASLFSEHGLSSEHIFCGDNTNLPYADGQFHGVFSSHCLEHSKDLGRTFSELRRIVSPGGTLVFAVPRNWDRAEEHIYAPLNGGWEAFTERHGFQVISSNLGCYYGEGGEYDLMIVAIKN